MALEYIHSRKVLHRDIKSSNIFLTGNNTVKLGDFGISRVLENTCDAAQTWVGTPYYLSPEVWENKPYTFKSDVWALGWVLYELCTLEHAFSADNLLGLVYKIVQDKHSPIPDLYSEDLKKIVELLLFKDSTKRPLVSDLLVTPFAAQKMQEFIENGGFIGNQKLPVRKIKPNRIDNSGEEGSIKSMASSLEEAKQMQKAKSYQEDELKGLSPKEKADLRKKKQADAEAQKLMEHTRGAINNYSYAKKRMDQEFHRAEDVKYSEGKIKAGHQSQKAQGKKDNLEANYKQNMKTNKYQGGIVMGDPKKVIISNYTGHPIDENEEINELASSSSFADSFAANDRDEQERTFAANDRDEWEDTFAANDRDEKEDTFAANDRDEWEDTFAANDRDEREDTFAANDREITQFAKSKAEGTFLLSETAGTKFSELSLEDSNSQTINKPIQQKAVSFDDRKIVSSGKYDPEEYYYNYELYQSDEFEEDEDEHTIGGTVVEAEKDHNELTSIVANYQNFLNNDKSKATPNDKDEEFQKEQEKLHEKLSQIEDLPIQETAKIQLRNNKMQIMQILGQDLYDKVYNILKSELILGTEDPIIHKKIRKIIPHNNSKIVSKWFELHQIVFMEILRGV